MRSFFILPVVCGTINPLEFKKMKIKNTSTENGIIRELNQAPLDPDERQGAERAAEKYEFLITKHVMNLINWNDPNDPLKLQFVPDERELERLEGEKSDPVGDTNKSPMRGLVHRYSDRVLLLPTLRCSVRCRFCFRKSAFSSSGGDLKREELKAAFEYVASDDEIKEVILTGGDPLMCSNRDISYIVENLNEIRNLDAVRIHTRMPATAPARIDRNLIELLKIDKRICVVIHCNHSKEISPEMIEVCRRMREAGFVLFTQSVLLKGVNNDPAVLRELFRKALYSLGARPYYLHHCDLAEGTWRFRTSIEEGMHLMSRLREHISGTCVPAYVLDLPEGRGKTPLNSSHAMKKAEQKWMFKTRCGQTVTYVESLKI